MIDVRFNRGIHLPDLDLWLDPWDAKPRAFVSHAHADHFARHERAICSEVTAQLVQKRYHVSEDRLISQPFHVPILENGYRLRLIPAGHIAGSAMLHVTRIKDNATLLYTGDFKTRRGRTAEAVNFISADTLIMETTFGLPMFEFPNQLEVESSILRFVHDAFSDGETPVLLGYALGKAQEAIALLAEHDIPMMMHPGVAQMTEAYRDIGLDLPAPRIFEGSIPSGYALIAPPNAIRSRFLRGLKSKRVAMLSGWALQPGVKYRFRVDEVIPLSDHADHSGLMECIQRVRPKRVLTVHGYAQEFAAELRARRMDAWSAMGNDQLELLIQEPSKRATSFNTPRYNRVICHLADFSDLCRLVGETSSRVAKVKFVASYLAGLENNEDVRLAAFWLTGEALPRQRGKRALHVGPSAIRRALLRIPGAREDRYIEISSAQNDSARTARLLLQELPLKPTPLDLSGLKDFFSSLNQANGSLERIDLLAHRLASLHPMEGETIVKLLTGDLRIGLKESLVEEAIAIAFQSDSEEVRHANMLTGDIGETALMARDQRLHEATIHPMTPVKVMLASPLERDNHGTLPKFGQLPLSPPYWLEPKYDGIRAQLHKSGTDVALFSRDLRLLNDEFPEIIAAAQEILGNVILDGELIAYADDRKLGFPDLQKRLGRTMAGEDLFLTQNEHELSVPLRLVAFDLLWHNGEDLLSHALTERHSRLYHLGLQPPFEVIPKYDVGDVSEIETQFKHAIQRGHEGLIAKDPNGPYTPGTRGKSWIKLKGVMPTLDCVVVAAEQGHGKRSDLFSDYTFAVRDEESGDLKVIGKAYSGLTDLEIEELTEHFKRHTLRTERHKRWVVPNVVLEIAFDAIRPSSRHDSGLALRFPRIKAIRKDKTPAEIDTLQSARALVG